MAKKQRKHNQKHKCRWGRTIGLVVLGVVFGFFALTIAWVAFYKVVPVQWTPLMSIRKYEAKHPKMDKRGRIAKPRILDLRHDWVAIEDISPALVRAVIASEDNLFMQHKGFSRRGIAQAVEEKIATGRVKHGGSTISQQTAKNVFCTHHRTFWRKGFEAYFTVLIEWIWGKERIMEVYLNVIEMGDGVFGAEAAARHYFHHSAKHLTRSESALIAACLPNPRRLSVSHPSAYVQKRKGQIIDLMPKMGRINLKEERTK